MRAFGAGAVAGLGIAVPVGAIAVLIVDRAMRRGFVAAVPAALGAASADLTYATVAALAGIGVAAALGPYERTIQLTSAAVLLAIAAYRMWRLFATRPEEPRTGRADGGPATVYAAFLGLTLVNPTTVAYFAALMLGLGGDTLGSGADKALFVAGAFLASAGWQLVLAAAGAILHHRLPERARLATGVVGNLVIAALALRLAFGV